MGSSKHRSTRPRFPFDRCTQVLCVSVAKTKEQTMRRVTLPVAATSAVLSAAAMIAGAANASPLGAATNANAQVSGGSVQQVNWDGSYGYYDRPYFHHHRF